jgi:hypothetical protein
LLPREWFACCSASGLLVAARVVCLLQRERFACCRASGLLVAARVVCLLQSGKMFRTSEILTGKHVVKAEEGAYMYGDS